MIEILRQLVLAYTALISLLTAEPKLGVVADPFIQSIDNSQATYFQQKGRYWQGLKLSATTAERNSRPHYQQESWNDLMTVPEKIPFETEVHQYSGPYGKGYEIIQRKEEGGIVYLKNTNRGPETWRNHDWRMVEDRRIMATTTP